MNVVRARSSSRAGDIPASQLLLPKGILRYVSQHNQDPGLDVGNLMYNRRLFGLKRDFRYSWYLDVW